MSAIYKLSIQGIRSFDSNDRETIEFGKPLTLIVGSNGSGKTTIIECLKYATTGDLPPNSKGGAFVHDPKITGEKDMRAQVKLAFTSANGLNMIVTRNIQLLVKRTNTTFKTLEGQLVSITKNGDRSTLCTKAVDLDSQVPLHMGVPKAILDYVIFCHQEDSLWPLSEPSNLKKKFDEIFQAVKFTKVLDNLKVIKKDMNVEIRLLKQSVEHLKIDRDRSKVTKLNITKLETKYRDFTEKVGRLEIELQKVTEESDELFKSNQNFQKTISRLENLMRMRDSSMEQMARLKESIEVVDLPKEKLEVLLKDFDESLVTKQLEVDSLKKDINSKTEALANMESSLNMILKRQGELEATKQIYLKNQREAKALSTEMASKYNVNTDTITNSSDEAVAELTRIRNGMKEEQRALQQSYSTNVNSLNQDKTSLLNEKAVQLQKLEYNKSDREKLLHSVELLQSEKMKISVTDADVNNEQLNLDNLSEKLKKWESQGILKSLASQIDEKNTKMILLDNDLEKIQEKIKKSNQQSEQHAKLSILKATLVKKQSEREKYKALFLEDNFSKNHALTVSNDILTEFNKVYITIQKNVASNKKECFNLQNEVTETAISLKNAEQELAQNKSKIVSLQKTLEETLPEDCTIEDYDDILLESEASYKTAVENLKMHQTTLEFNRKALEVANENNCCYLCSRKFNEAESKSKLLQELEKKVAPGFEAVLKETLDSEKTYYTAIRALEKDVSSLKDVENKIASQEATSNLLKAELKSKQSKLATIESEGNKIKEERDHFEKVLRPIVDSIVRLDNEIKDINQESQLFAEELNIYNSSQEGVQIIDELQATQKQMNENLRSMRKELNGLQNEKQEKLSEYSNLVNLIKEKQLKLSESKSLLTKLNTLTENLQKKQQEIEDINRWLENITNDQRILDGRLDIINEKLLTLENTRGKEIECKKAELDEFEQRLNSLLYVHEQMKSFERGQSNELEDCYKEMTEMQNKIQQIKKSITTGSAHFSEQEKKLNDSNNERRNLKYNIEFLNLKSSLNDTNQELATLDAQNAEKERAKYQEDTRKLRSKYESLSSENAGILGEMKQLQNQIDSLKYQLKTDFKNIDGLYHKEWVELQTKTLVTDDIDTYSKALDSAIMKYHGLKMQDINKIIDELWKRTYSGTDVDTIQIKSDEIGQAAKGKSYNYRIVMFKQDAELDMRGRCSAGQKVLASIIIRLALSETFGVNCGVIALDEPTTNLDEENIESLAKSLGNIIQLRRHQKNFQLIVITHDEKFLSHMNAAQFTDHFFQVKRDDRQKSLIEWVDINKVSD